MQALDFPILESGTLSPEGDEDLPLGDTTKNFIREEIKTQLAQAIDELNPHGYRRVTRFIREWGLAGALIATPLALLALAGAGWNYAFSRVDKEARFQSDTDNRLKNIESDIDSIKKTLADFAPLLREATIKRVTEASSLTPRQLSERLPDLKSLAATAKAENIALKPEVVETVGKKLVAAGSADAWTAAIDFVNYKSFLNTSLSIEIKNILPEGETLTTHYHTRSPDGFKSPIFQVAGVVPHAQSAHVLTLDTPDPDASLPMGNDWIFETGGGVMLDGARLKKVIFKNVYVVYRGGPFEVEDVYFLNCIFDINQQSNGERLALALLNPSPSTTLNNSSDTAELFLLATHY